jgi:hypothetical protein
VQSTVLAHNIEESLIEIPVHAAENHPLFLRGHAVQVVESRDGGLGVWGGG